MCDCGKETIVYESNLGKCTFSCGCLSRDKSKEHNSKHGQSRTRLFTIWSGMRHRCRNPKLREYPDYGGRGIKVCKEWDDSFEAFRDWAMSHGYTEELTLDRIDNDGNYEPSNCRWITMKEQQANKRNNVLLTYNGETHIAKEWARRTGLSYRLIMCRLHYGWSAERTLSTPPRHYQRRKA